MIAPGTRVWIRTACGAGWAEVRGLVPLADAGEAVYLVADGAGRQGYLHESDLIPVPAALPAARVQDGGRA